MSRWYPCVYCTEDLHCTKYEEPDYESWCVLGPCTAETPSNGDLIRRMDDKELAELLADTNGDFPPDIPPEIRVPVNECEKCWLDWLKKPAKEESS